MAHHFCLSHGLDFLNNTRRIMKNQTIEGFHDSATDNNDFTDAVSNYDISNATLADKAAKFIGNNLDSNDYSGKIIKMTNGRRGYVTDKNIFKYIETDSIRDAAINNNCGTSVEDVNFTSEKYSTVGDYLGTTPDFLVGEPMDASSVCMSSGINLQITGHVDTGSLAEAWVGCYNQVGDFFDQQVDLTGGYDGNNVRRCAIRAADVGSSTFYIGKDLSSNYTCFTSKQNLTTDHITNNMGPGIKRVTSLVVHSAELSSSHFFGAGIMNNGQIAVGNMPSDTVDNFGSSVSNPVVMTRINNNGDAVPVGGIGNCDKVYGSKIHVVSASYGRNCDSAVADDNWLSVINSRINTLPYQSVKIFANGDPEPAQVNGCIKNFSASYQCSPETTDKIVNVVSGSSDFAIFDCSDNYGRCTEAVLTLTDTGNLTLTNGTNPTPLWESKTSAVGIAILGNKAINGKNFLRTGEVLFHNDFIGSPSGNCILLCEKIGNRCSLSIVYYLWGCKAYDVASGSSGDIPDGNEFRATYSISEPNKDKSLNGKVIYINGDMKRMTYPDSMLSLSDTYIDAGPYAQSGPIIATSTSDLSECKTKCNNNNECYGFIHYASNDTCELKKKTELFPSKLTRILSDDAKMFIRKYNIANPNSCSGVIRNETEETGATATKIPEGVDMSSSTKCMLGRAISTENANVRAQETSVLAATDRLLTRVGVLNTETATTNSSIMNINTRISEKQDVYDAIDLENNSVANNDNINAMTADANLENIRQNLNYMAWTAGAAIAIFAIIKASR